MNGILCVNKPQDFTSFDVVAKLRGILRMRRLGHAGTLDPMATGVLPVFVGNATKACDIVPDNTKSYRAGFRLGFRSDTQDVWGEVSAVSDEPVSFEELSDVLPFFTGRIMQLPPMYSAVQVGGKRLYDLARQGIEVEREAREIEVSSIRALGYDPEKREGELEIICGKGTYIRTIINDIGERLGCGGVMTSLERTSSCGFTLADCHTFAEIEAARDADRLGELIVPADRIFASFPKIVLSEGQSKAYRNGVKLSLERLDGVSPEGGAHRVYGWDGAFYGTAFPDAENGVLRIGKNLG